MGFFDVAKKIVGGASKILNTAMSVIQKPMEAVTGVVSKLAEKLPFGLGKIVAPLVQKFLPQAMSFLMPGGLGVFNSLLKAMPTLQKITNVVDTVNGALGGIDQLRQGNPAALQNIIEMVAHRQAQTLPQAQ